MRKRTSLKELTALLGGHPRETAIKLLRDHGLTPKEIAEKFEVSTAAVRVWTKEVRKAQPALNKRHVAPDGKPLAQWLRDNNIKSIKHSHVIRRLDLGWDFYDAVYREINRRTKPCQTPA